MFMRRMTGGLLATALVVALGGCSGGGDDLPRQAVSGTVTLGGQPLPHGSIQFLPASEGALPGGAVIQDGAYAIARSEGLVPGTYRVVISGTDAPVAEAELDGGPVTEVPKELVPARYNSESTLEVDVTEGANTHDFPLET